MKTRSITALAVGLVAVLSLGGSPAGAGTELGPEIVDPAGDGNFTGFVAPVHVDGADLRAIWFETGYHTVTETDESGNVTAVRHVPDALLVKIKTEGPPRPTFGPTLMVRVPAQIVGCEVWFQAIVRGPSSTPVEPPEMASIRKITSTCPGGATSIPPVTLPSHTASPFGITFEGNVIVLRYPFSVLPYASNQIVLGKDVEIRPIATKPHVATYLGAVTAPNVDDTAALATRFRIGSDLPRPVDCVATPEGHTLCQDGTQSQTG